MSQQEDDLRALAKIMDFLRAVSIILVVMNVYWFCYEAIRLWGIDIGVADRILVNFNRTAGLFRSVLYTKLFAVLLLALSCLGTKGVKGEKIKMVITENSVEHIFPKYSTSVWKSCRTPISTYCKAKISSKSSTNCCVTT